MVMIRSHGTVERSILIGRKMLSNFLYGSFGSCMAVLPRLIFFFKKSLFITGKSQDGGVYTFSVTGQAVLFFHDLKRERKTRCW